MRAAHPDTRRPVVRPEVLRAAERAADLVLALDDVGAVCAVGSGTAGALGRASADLLGADPQSWLGEDSAELLRAELGRPGPRVRRLRLWRRDGADLRACRARLADLRDDPQVGAFLLTAVEEDGPAGSRAGVASFLDAAGVGHLTLDEAGAVTDADPAAARVLGADPAQLLGRHPFAEAAVVSLTGADPVPLADGGLAALAAGAAGELVHLRLPRPGRAPVWLQTRWQTGPGGRVHVWLHEATGAFAAYTARAEGERGLAALLEDVGDLVLVLAADGSLAWASPAARQALGPAATGRPVELVHPDDAPALAREWAQLRTGAAGAVAATVRIGPGGGPWRTVDLRLTDRRADPAVAGVVVRARDVTEERAAAAVRRGTQHALMASLRQDDPAAALAAICASLEQLLGQEHPGTAVALLHVDTDGAGGRVTRQQHGPRLRGLGPLADSLGPQLADLLAPGPQGPRPLGALPVAVRAVSGLGGYRHAWTLVLRGPAEEPLGVLAVLLERERGPQERERAALERFGPLAALLVARHLDRVGTRESDARFRSVFHDTPVPSALVSTAGVFLEVNPALARLVGAGAAELVGTAVADLGPATPAEPGGGGPLRCWRTRDGQARWVEATAADVTDATGAVLYRVEHYLDVTARRASEEEVRLLNELLCARIAELDAARERLAAAFRKITQVREDERRALAIGLHDDTVQQLIVATWMLEDLDPAEADPQVASVRTQLQATIDGVRGVISDLRPPSLDTMGLAAALEQRAVTVLGDQVAVRVLDELPGPLPAELQTLVYRTAAEALRNVRKHARAGAVEIGLSLAGGAVVVRVADDGVGFDAAEAARRAERGHLGVTSMREQIVLAGGRFQIGGRADGATGTEVCFALPGLPAAAAPAVPA